MKEEREKKIRDEIDKLVSEGDLILLAQQYRIAERENPEQIKNLSKESREQWKEVANKFPLRKSYQHWYSLALPVVRQLAPDRLDEFTNLYRVESRKELNVTTYGISDYLHGISTTRGLETNYYHGTFEAKFQIQIDILSSISSRVANVLADIRGVLATDLLDDEFGAARELLRNGHLRAAGMVAGVALEAHLKHVADRRAIKIGKKKPSISDYNDLLKSNDVIDVPKWRQIQRLADLRNLCGHKAEREPTKDEVDELISSTEKISNTLF